jgi:hypothetical protein
MPLKCIYMPEFFITLFLGELKVFIYSRTKTVLLKYVSIAAGYIFPVWATLARANWHRTHLACLSTDASTRAPDKALVSGQLFLLVPGIFVLNVCAKYFAGPLLVQIYFKCHSFTTCQKKVTKQDVTFVLNKHFSNFFVRVNLLTFSAENPR